MTVWGLDLLFHAVSIFAHSFHVHSICAKINDD